MPVPQLHPIVIRDETWLDSRDQPNWSSSVGLGLRRWLPAVIGIASAMLVLAIVVEFTGGMTSSRGTTARQAPIRQIAFNQLQHDRNQIFTIMGDGTRLQQVTTEDANHTQIAWSPDGKMIAFVSDIDGHEQIYIIASNGTNERRLANDDARDLAPIWSPDGNQIAFLSIRGTASSISIINRDGSNVRQLTDPTTTERIFLPLTWSPDGRTIAFANGTATQSNIAVVTVSDAKIRQFNELAGQSTNPAWSPDGKEVVFTHNTIVDGATESHLYAMQADGSQLRQITTGAVRDDWPVWSPDGRQIAFVREQAASYAIWLMNADGSNLQQLNSAPPGQLYEFLTWSPDGQTIVFARQPIVNAASGVEALETIDVDGQNQRTLSTHLVPGSWPALQPTQ